jgi:Cd2+/Zn2+-exporting ATPase/Cu+-exporting ATPase
MVAGGLLMAGLFQLRFGPPEMANIAHLIIALASWIVALPIFIIAARGVMTGNPNTFSAQLVALATLAAMAAGDFVTATLIPVIMSIGHFLEERSILGAQVAIEGLRKLHARSATILTSEGEQEVHPDSLKPSDVLVVRPGEVVAADGEVIAGSSAVDQSPITGESAPEDVGSQDLVFAGSVNLTGLLRVRVVRSGSQTALGRVVELLRDAEQSKTPVLQLIERYAGYYVPIILTIAAVVLFVTHDISRTVAVLVVACPGAFILAGPTAMVASLAAASRHGILIKNTRFLESLADVDTVILDKTGTLTLGQLQLVAMRPLHGLGEKELIRLALPCASGSRHPACRAIVAAAAALEFKSDHDATEFEEISGKGTRVTSKDGVRLLGRGEWLIEEGLPVPENPAHSGSIVWLGRPGRDGSGKSNQVDGCFLLDDTPRPEAKEALRELKELGVRRSILLTGDRTQVADRIGQELEMDEIIAEVLPEQKLEVVRRERANGNTVMVVGDGINDALALASGDVGVALGAAASGIALKSADVALLASELNRLPLAVRLARRTRLRIHQNVAIGAITSVTFVWLACVGIIAPLVGALLHNVGAAIVIVNSARLLGFGRTRKKGMAQE